MTKVNLPEKTNPNDPRPALVVKRKPGETDGAAVARTLMEPDVRHGIVASNFAKKIIVTDAMSGLMDHADHVTAMGDKAAAGDLEMASRMLAAQAVTLDNMFTELARRAALNMADYPDAMDRYGRLALKAQSNCRACLDTLAKLHLPREQTVRHVHVNDGGQAIVTDQFHHHASGGENAKLFEQSHATGAIGQGCPMPCPDANGDTVSVAGGEGTEAMPDARRDQSRRTQG